MSKEILTRCDMCGSVVVERTEHAICQATFYRSGWDEAFDLCSACADEVQRFIAEGRHGEGGADGR